MTISNHPGWRPFTDPVPPITSEIILRSLVPPAQFTTAQFASYFPDEAYPSQAYALQSAQAFAQSLNTHPQQHRNTSQTSGIYFDGGFGVGKTHILASIWNSAPGQKCFGTFIEYTALVGALGYQKTKEFLSQSSLICIDEFELDDPGDTMMMSRLLSELVSVNTRVAATSNTPPGSLGEGRFSAVDFLREIHGLAQHFEVIPIDGVDYRHRETATPPTPLTPTEFEAELARIPTVAHYPTLVSFDVLLKHLENIHPAGYLALVEHIDVLAICDVHMLDNHNDALRFVSFIDRAYNCGISIIYSGHALHNIFTQDMLESGYSKKYLRAISRIVALTSLS